MGQRAFRTFSGPPGGIFSRRRRASSRLIDGQRRPASGQRQRVLEPRFCFVWDLARTFMDKAIFMDIYEHLWTFMDM